MLQLFVSLMLIARATSKQVRLHYSDTGIMKVFSQAMTVLNHAGVCLSYDATWLHMSRLVEQEDYHSQLQQGRWLWVYDNFNMH